MTKHILDHFVENYRQAIVDAAVMLMRHPSEKAEPAEGAPFGLPIAACLKEALMLCDSLGFRTKNCDGYVGWAEIGSGEEMIAILVHLDVVPAGDGWTHDPFGGEVVDGILYGRGTTDDKGPAAAAIYAVKALADSTLSFHRRVRIIFGADEENNWDCINHYLKTEEIPVAAFSPDAEFPVIFGEKGVLFATISGSFSANKSDLRIVSLQGGQRPNMVPDRCRAELAVPIGKEPLLAEMLTRAQQMPDVQVELSPGNVTLQAQGLVAHGSTPENGKNAISMIFELLALLPELAPAQRTFVEFYQTKLGYQTNGENFLGPVHDEPSGNLVLNTGVITMEKDVIQLRINIRYPVTFTGSQIEEKIRRGLEGIGLTVRSLQDSAPLYHNKNSPIVTKLLAVYHSYRADSSQPLLIGGGTYARSIPNAVAFGPVFPGQPELAHCPDERISIDDLILNTKIYAQAALELAK